MTEFFRRIFDSGLMPQGGITLGRPAATWLEVVSDALIAIAYFSILVTLTCFVRNRRDLPIDGCLSRSVFYFRLRHDPSR
jgi:hypothetical protein